MTKKVVLILFLLVHFLYPANNVFRIIASANINNEIDPCGWKKKPTGGLARRATVIDDFKEDVRNHYIVDAGNLLFKKTISAKKCNWKTISARSYLSCSTLSRRWETNSRLSSNSCSLLLAFFFARTIRGGLSRIRSIEY